MDKQFITTINGIEIAAVRDEEHNFFVPVRPICDALTLNVSGQIQAVKRHRILGSVVCNLHTTGADGKTYEMVCLPLEFVYGWLFSIDTNLVAEERRDIVEKYQLECYQALYTHFAGKARRQQEQNSIERDLLRRKAAALDSIATLKKAIAENNAEIKEVDGLLDSLQEQRLNPQPSLFD